ncbi:response regulator [Dictyobacter arantiisoli]|uniref:histidine kinase n=1 Tax=Dictyobacter arantiisoli TaxID=2014874 RepID=A0A5A5T9E1_9CHLR|nr:response regulator [Dictyobacter arantiisoli]GCF07947.1 hypothetical protein KDI_15110 [Dictyobacter arantiisoli]
MDNKNMQGVTASLFYDDERDCLLLDGHELSRGEKIEIRVFGSWIPGQVSMDSAGWFLLTLDQVGIRLHTGLSARSSDFRFSEPFAPSPDQDKHSPHILLVDDDPALLNALPRMISLRLPHITVETVCSSQAALEQIAVTRYDTIISDIRMPGMNGLELLQKIQEFQSDTPTILITGHGEHNIAIQALRGGAYDYIQKPIERDNFVAALLRAIQVCQLRRQVQEQQEELELYARSLERLVQQRTTELAEAHTTKDKVVSLVSRELKEPIQHLKDMTQMLRQKLGSNEPSEIVTRSFGDIEVSIARTELLLQELLNASDMETQRFILHRQRYDLLQLCREILEEKAECAGLHLDCEGMNVSVAVDVDEEQIRQVLCMLFDNTCTSSLECIPTTITLQQAAYEAIITIRDHGTQVMGAEFYVSRKIIECHRGHLEVQHFPEGRRALFITLPLFCNASNEESDVVSPIPRTHAVWTIFRDAENMLASNV